MAREVRKQAKQLNSQWQPPIYTLQVMRLPHFSECGETIWNDILINEKGDILKRSMPSSAALEPCGDPASLSTKTKMAHEKVNTPSHSMRPYLDVEHGGGGPLPSEGSRKRKFLTTSTHKYNNLKSIPSSSKTIRSSEEEATKKRKLYERSSRAPYTLGGAQLQEESETLKQHSDKPFSPSTPVDNEPDSCSLKKCDTIMISSVSGMRQTKKDYLSGGPDTSQTSESSDKDTITVLISDHSSLEDEYIEADFLEEADPVPRNGENLSSTSPDSEKDTPRHLPQPIHHSQEASEDDEEESNFEYCILC